MNTHTSTVLGPVARVYVVELERGDVTVFGETVESVHRYTDHQTLVIMTDGSRHHYSKGTSTILIKA